MPQHTFQEVATFLSKKVVKYTSMEFYWHIGIVCAIRIIMQHLLQVVLEYGGHLSSSLPQYAATTLLQKEYSSISLFLICFVFALQLIRICLMNIWKNELWNAYFKSRHSIKMCLKWTLESSNGIVLKHVVSNLH